MDWNSRKRLEGRAAWLKWVRGTFHGCGVALILSFWPGSPLAGQTLTRIQDIRALTPPQAAENRPVEIDAVVTYSDPSLQTLFVQDSTGAIFIGDSGPKEFEPGLRMTITGVTSAGSFTPIVSSPRFTPKSLGSLPVPRRSTHTEIQSGSLDCEWVEILGRVRAAFSTTNGGLELLVATADGRQTAWIRKANGLNLQALTGAMIQLRGVCAGGRGLRSDLLSFDVFASTAKDVALVEPATRSAADSTVALLRALPPVPNPSMVAPKRLRGRVTLCWPGEMLFVEDNTGSIQVKTRQVTAFARGDVVEVVGFPSHVSRKVLLEDCKVTKVEAGPPPGPVTRTLKELYSRGSHGELVTVEGRLTDVALQPQITRAGWSDLAFQTAPILVVESDGWFFHATLPGSSSQKEVEHLERGALLSLTGVSAAQDMDPDAPQVYRLLLQDAADIHVKQSPPWWTARRLAMVIGGLAALGVAAMGWVAWFHARLLRMAEKSIRQRNEQIIRHQGALLELATLGGAGGTDTLKSVTEVAARTLSVGRASVWLFEEHHEELYCMDLFIAETGLHEMGAKLEVRDYRRYFTALEDSLTINAVDARTDRRTSEFTAQYLEPLGITSMLDVPIRSGGVVVGAFCLEQLHVSRKWTMEEQNFAAAVADHVSLILEAEEKAKAQQALKEALADMERRVFLRTSELAEAKERAESADRVKSAFLATMSHELRTPLNSILGFTGIIHQGLVGPLNAEQKKQLGLVMNSARHLLSLINDVLDISKIEANQVEIRLEPFDVRESIQKIAKMVEPLAEKKQLKLGCVLDDAVGSIHSDRRRYEQVLINLLNNAVKFTERGTIQVTCRVSDGYLVTEVTDTGMGIKPEHLGIIFKPFRQVDTGLTRQHEGTGLGLAICERLVVLLGGTISVESAWGEGSTFRFQIPMAPPSAS